MEIDEKLGTTSPCSLRRVVVEEDKVREPRPSKPLTLMPYLGISIALVVYCFANGHFFVGVWLAATFLAWAFLFGVANTTDQSSCARKVDGESRSNPSIRSGRRKSVSLRGAAPKRRSRAGGLKTGYRASVKTRSAVRSSRPGESIGSTYSLLPATARKYRPDHTDRSPRPPRPRGVSNAANRRGIAYAPRRIQLIPPQTASPPPPCRRTKRASLRPTARPLRFARRLY